MVAVAEDEVRNLRYGTGVIRGSIHIEHRYRFGQFAGGEAVRADIVLVDKVSVVPESTRELIDLTSAVSVVSILTLSFKDRGSSSVEAMTSFCGSLRSQRGRNVRTGSGFGTSLAFSTGSSISGILSTDRTENRL